jgi:hypothetical protein
MAAAVKLDVVWPARRQLTLTLPLPLVKNPQYAWDCPMLDSTIQFSLDGQAPISVQRGYYDYTEHDWGEPTRACYRQATVVFEVPLAGGRLPLAATSADGQASMMVDIAAAFQPTIVDPQPSYPRASEVKLQLPPDFLASLGLDVLPVHERDATCNGASPICFEVSLYRHDAYDDLMAGYAQGSAVGCDGTTLSIPIPANADYQLDDLYLTYNVWAERAFPVDACVGFGSCSGILGIHGIFAPVTINATW